MEKLKILHLPTSVGGNSYGLSLGEKRIGMDSRVLYVSQNKFKYHYDILLERKNCLISKLIKSVYFILFSINQYDVLHFNFGTTLIDYPKFFLNQLDLKLYRKKIILVTYNGSDARKYFNNVFLNGYIVKSELPEIKISKRRIRQIEKRLIRFNRIGATFLTVNPDLIKFLPKGSFFLPYTLSNWYEISNCNVTKNKLFTIIHSPTDRLVKGTDKIVDAINNLKIKFPNQINLLIVENYSNDVALELYRKADLVVDQIRIGWYGAFAVECMKMGKPVLTYIHEPDLFCLPEGMANDCLKSFVNANEFNISEKIEYFFTNRDMLEEVRLNGVKYVEKWHNPEFVANYLWSKVNNEIL